MEREKDRQIERGKDGPTACVLPVENFNYISLSCKPCSAHQANKKIRFYSERRREMGKRRERERDEKKKRERGRKMRRRRREIWRDEELLATCRSARVFFPHVASKPVGWGTVRGPNSNERVPSKNSSVGCRGILQKINGVHPLPGSHFQIIRSISLSLSLSLSPTHTHIFYVS